MNIYLLALLVLIINVPFGYWRSNVRRYSLQFLLAIHIPVLLIILFRILSTTGFELTTLFYTMPVFFLGQYAGSKVYSFRKNNGRQPLTSCLVMDVIKVEDKQRY